MTLPSKHDPIRELEEIRKQLSYTKRLGFLFGAGTSKSMGIPDIVTLTKNVEDDLKGDDKSNFLAIKSSLHPSLQHIEAILNQIRLVRAITNGDKTKAFDGLTGEQAIMLDKAICDGIYRIISKAEEVADLSVSRSFVAWLNWISRDFTKEIFTTNYDLIFERSFESLRIPFYDGFVGSREPFFVHESLDGKSNHDRPPVSWIRLWKLHGSLGWFWKLNDDNKSHRVIRLTDGAKDRFPNAELVIYPSRDKYESSRKQPFTSYFDRLKEFLLGGEGMFVVSGYSFSDDHINEVIFNCLNQNNRLHVLAFLFEDSPVDKIVSEGKNVPNLTIIGPKKASISGLGGEWKYTKGNELVDPLWDSDKLKLGDFRELVKFLITSSGFKDKSTR